VTDGQDKLQTGSKIIPRNVSPKQGANHNQPAASGNSVSGPAL
jgi:hypothetical protein